MHTLNLGLAYDLNGAAMYLGILDPSGYFERFCPNGLVKLFQRVAWRCDSGPTCFESATSLGSVRRKPLSGPTRASGPFAGLIRLHAASRLLNLTMILGGVFPLFLRWCAAWIHFHGDLGLQEGWIHPLRGEGLQWPGDFGMASALPLRCAPAASPVPGRRGQPSFALGRDAARWHVWGNCCIGVRGHL